MLNEEAKTHTQGIQSTETTAEPLDMCCGYHRPWLQRLNSGPG